VAHFMQHGYCVIPSAFTPEQAREVAGDVFERLGYDPNDKKTWVHDDANMPGQEKINMPIHRRFHANKFAPKAWGAITELVGGEDRIDPVSKLWGDGIIANFGNEYWENRAYNPQDLDNWHADGDFFVHFLDSREQGLLIIPLFSDIRKGGGGTYICPEAIPHVARKLRDHPEGIDPASPLWKQNRQIVYECTDFREMTGKTGDVILLHPLMLHSASHNTLREIRLITNPPVALNEPFQFNRPNPDDYSLVEKFTLKSLGVEKLDYKITSERRLVVPDRIRRQARMKEQELKRLNALKAKVSVDSKTDAAVVSAQ